MCEWSGFATTECASASLVNVQVVWFSQHRNVRVLVWSMCEWCGFYNTGRCEWYFGQCASGLVLTTPECASGSLVNVREVWFLQQRNVRVLVWSMSEPKLENAAPPPPPPPRNHLSGPSKIFFLDGDTKERAPKGRYQARGVWGHAPPRKFCKI